MTVPPPEPPSSVCRLDAPVNAEVSAVIIRACAACQGPRSIGEPCARCGNPQPPEVTDLGTISAVHDSPLERLRWSLFKQPLADLRIKLAGQRTEQLRGKSA